MSKTLLLGGNGYIGSALYSKIDADSVDLCLFINNLDTLRLQILMMLILVNIKTSYYLQTPIMQMCNYNKGNAWINNVDYFYNLCEKLGDDQLLIYASSAIVWTENKYFTESDLNIHQSL